MRLSLSLGTFKAQEFLVAFISCAPDNVNALGSRVGHNSILNIWPHMTCKIHGYACVYKLNSNPGRRVLCWYWRYSSNSLPFISLLTHQGYWLTFQMSVKNNLQNYSSDYILISKTSMIFLFIGFLLFFPCNSGDWMKSLGHIDKHPITELHSQPFFFSPFKCDRVSLNCPVWPWTW